MMNRWWLHTFPEPAAWLQARLAFTRCVRTLRLTLARLHACLLSPARALFGEPLASLVLQCAPNLAVAPNPPWSHFSPRSTNAVWCITGHMLGLGDRHGENILIDKSTGDTVHVDFGCLFDRGLTLEVRGCSLFL